MSGYKKDYTMADDKIYSKYGKIVQMMDDLQSAGCFDTTFSQPVFRIAVTGPNGSGKDSFINSLLGFPFLPPNCKSKRQMEIRVIHSVEDISPMVQIEELKKSFTNHLDCSKNLADLQKATNDTNENISIRLNFTTNMSADLYIISTCQQDPSNQHCESLLKEAIAPSNHMIILVLEAMHLSDSFMQVRDHWFNLVKNYDPNLERTMVVLTKCDILPNNYNYNKMKQFLRETNEIFNPKYGFVCVKTNFATHIEPSQQMQLEREYFCNHKVLQYLNINDYFTIDTAGSKITKWIFQQNEFKKTLIFAYSKLQDRMKYVESELQKYGNEFIDFSKQSKDLYLQSLMHIFSDTVVKIFSGKCEIEEYSLSNTQINKLHVDFLGDYIDFQPSLSFKNKDIIDAIQISEESGLAGFPSGDVIYSLLENKFEDLRNELTDYLEKIYNIVSQLFKNLINRYFSLFPKALTTIEELILAFVEKEFNKIKDLQKDLSEMNFTYLYVDEMSDRYKNLIQNNLLKRSYTPESNSLMNKNQNNEFPFKENKDISFFKSAKDKDGYYQSLADYVKALVDYIYAEIIRNLRGYIPKSTSNFFIKSLKTNMIFYLLQYLSKNPEFCQELEEDPEIAQKRVYLVDASQKLKKINKMWTYDEQITKIVKGDNIKNNIDTILQSQDINPQNASQIDKEVGNQSAKNLSLKKEKENNLFGPKKDNKGTANLFGVPPKKASNPNVSKPNISSTTKNNLFGPPTTNKNTTNTTNATKTNNLFGNNTNKNVNNNLFGNASSSNLKKASTMATNNLFGTPTQQQSKTTNNLFGNTKNDQQKKDLKVNLTIDPKQGGVTGVNIQGNIDPKDAMNFYQKNKQYMPTGAQMLSGAQKVNNLFDNNNNNNNANTKKNTIAGLANLFGTGKKK